ncbi:MAG TPA: AraC family transcriptional regulator [Puia sp.]|nr:AraC family transcriptional regulator [Puia sp.]
MKVQFSKPSEVLQPYIDRYWSWDATDNNSLYLPVVPPGAGLDLYLHYRKPFEIEGKGRLAESHLFFSWERATTILPSKSIGFIAIRFRAGMFKNFTDAPLAGLTDLYPGMEDLWGSNGRALMGRLNSAEDFSEKVELMEQFLTALLWKFNKDSGLWNNIINDLYYHQDVIRLDELAQRQGISYRHFRRRFIEETGMAPKQFQRLARFHSVLKPLLIHKEKHYLSTVLDKGYFDQMHFIKEFRYFLQCTPTEFLQEKNFMSHFYYPALSTRYNFAGK